MQYCVHDHIKRKKMARFIDPRVDWAFKRIFGSEDTKECLITFLNGLFEDELVIKDVTFAKTEKLGLRPDDRGVVFDVYCVTDEGKHVIVEMQKKEQEYFADRALYYTARAIVQQGVRGIWDYHLAPVYTVCFMDFVSSSPILKGFAPTWCLPICRHASECPTGCVLCTSNCHCSTSIRRQSVWIYLIVGFI